MDEHSNNNEIIHEKKEKTQKKMRPKDFFVKPRIRRKDILKNYENPKEKKE